MNTADTGGGAAAGVDAAKLETHLKRLVGIRHHETAPENLEAAADYILDRFSSFGLRTREQGFPAFGRQNRNIIGQIGPSDPGRPVLILGAHYDTVSRSPGADDNASGLAVLLEAARILASGSPVFPLLFIAFAQEESGCLGSRFFVQDFMAGGGALKGMAALECVGFASNEPGTQQRVPNIPISMPDRGDFIGIVGNPPASARIQGMEAAIKGMEEALPYLTLEVPGAGERLPDSRRSDHAPFWDAGLPALMLTDTANYRNPNYHQPGDRLETLNRVFIKQVAEAVVRFLRNAGE
ncbi:MAG TPA: M20/M25/M40 family metallo-hydrolase [Nitrospiria bacterium]